MSTRLAVLIATYNRIDTTRRNLDRLISALNTLDDVSFELFIADDASPDGTARHLRTVFPTAHVIDGSGHQYWNGGMVVAYQESLRSDQPFDAYLLFNDDVEVTKVGVAAAWSVFLTQINSLVVAGWTTGSDGQLSYGGVTWKGKWFPTRFHPVPVGQLQECDSLNGNFALIGGTAFRQLGGLDPAFTHGYGDLDLGLRARRIGLSVIQPAEPVGVCERGPGVQLPRGASLKERIVLSFSEPDGLKSYAHFLNSHASRWLAPILLVRKSVSIVMRCIFKRSTSKRA